MVTMYLDGVPIAVRPEDVPQMQARGALMYGKDDLLQLPAEIAQLFDQAKSSLQRFVDGVVADGFIDVSDASEGRALQQIMVRITQRVNDVLTVASLNYAVREAGETDQERVDRLATDARYLGFGAVELQQRFGLEKDEAEQVYARSQEIDYVPPTGEQWAMMATEAGAEGTPSKWIPVSEVPEHLRDRVVAIRTTAPEGED